MANASVTSAVVAIAVIILPVSAFAQSTGGAAGGVSSSPANAGGVNNSGNGNSTTVAPPPPPGTNSAGTANSSGVPGTVGSSKSKTNGDDDAAIHADDQAIDRKLKSICRGC